MHFAVYVAYRLRLETAFMADECASATAAAVAAEMRHAAEAASHTDKAATAPVDLPATSLTPETGACKLGGAEEGGGKGAPEFVRVNSAVSMIESVSRFQLSAPMKLPSATSSEMGETYRDFVVAQFQPSAAEKGASVRLKLEGKSCAFKMCSPMHSDAPPQSNGRKLENFDRGRDLSIDMLRMRSTGFDGCQLFESAVAAAVTSASAVTTGRHEAPILSCSPHVSVWRRALPPAEVAPTEGGASSSGRGIGSPGVGIVHSARELQSFFLRDSPFSSPLRQSQIPPALLKQLMLEDPLSLGLSEAEAQALRSRASSEVAVVREGTESVAFSHAPSRAGSDGGVPDEAVAAAASEELAAKTAALEICSLQRINTSLTSRNPAKGLLCQAPMVQSIQYYESPGGWVGDDLCLTLLCNSLKRAVERCLPIGGFHCKNSRFM